MHELACPPGKRGEERGAQIGRLTQLAGLHPQKATEQEKGEPPESGLVLMMLFNSDIHVRNEAS